MRRSAIFIDGGYLRKLSQNHFDGIRIDFHKLVSLMAEGSDLFRAYYYDCPPFVSHPATEEELRTAKNFDNFRRSLESIPKFHTRLGKLARIGRHQEGGPILVQKRVDMMLGMDMVDLAVTKRVDKVILLAGDSDFLPAVDRVKAMNVSVVVWHGPRGYGEQKTIHDELWFACDERFELTMELMEQLNRYKEVLN